MSDVNPTDQTSASSADQETIPRSPSSETSGQQRIVELLPHEDRIGTHSQNSNWTLRREFFDVDVAQNSDDIPGVNEGTGENDDDDIQDQDNDFGVFEVQNRRSRRLADIYVLRRVHDDDDNNGNVNEIDVNDDGDDDAEYVLDMDEIGQAEEDDFDDYDDDEDLIGEEVEGFVLAHADINLSSDSDENEEGIENNDNAHEVRNYDRTLPANHRYLGDDLCESRGRQVLAEGSVGKLPLFNLREIIIFPGQTLPLMTANLNPRIHMVFEACLRSNHTSVGLMSDPTRNQIGTTADIRNHHADGSSGLKLILEGRQRFILLSPPFETSIEGEVRILPEITLGHPYPRISSLARFFSTPDVPNHFIISKFPPWLLKRYEARGLMRRILTHIKDWLGSDLTRDPNEFSYWISSNLPIDNRDRIKALSFSCAEARLSWVLDLLERSEYFVCSHCDNILCHKKDVFSMSQSGPQCSFVNSHGYVHDTLTVRRARGLIQANVWSSEYSWFPGYVWRLAHCDACNRHIGWLYKNSDGKVEPRKFYGLSRANVRLLVQKAKIGPAETTLILNSPQSEN